MAQHLQTIALQVLFQQQQIHVLVILRVVLSLIQAILVHVQAEVVVLIQKNMVAIRQLQQTIAHQQFQQLQDVHVVQEQHQVVRILLVNVQIIAQLILRQVVVQRHVHVIRVKDHLIIVIVLVVGLQVLMEGVSALVV